MAAFLFRDYCRCNAQTKHFGRVSAGVCFDRKCGRGAAGFFRRALLADGVLVEAS